MSLFRQIINTYILQAPHNQEWKTKKRASPHTSFSYLRASVSLEAAMILPFFLCGITALLYLFTFSAHQTKENRALMEKAQVSALIFSQADSKNPYITLWDYENIALPFQNLGFGKESVVRKVKVRAWVGYSGESFLMGKNETIVYMTPSGTVYHKSRDCTHLALTIRNISFEKIEGERNESGGKYTACEHCVKKGKQNGMVYITDYGSSYHNSINCQGLKRTIMAVPLSEVGGRRCCSKCAAS